MSAGLDAGAGVVVAGGAGDIGSAIARLLAASGFDVVTVDSVEAASETDRSLVADLSDWESCADAVRQAIERLGRIDCLVNATGYLNAEPFVEVSPAEADRVLRANLVAPLNATRAVLPTLLENKAGLILNICSVWALGGGASRTVYATAKHGVLGLSRSLAAELRGTGVTVVSLSPGPVRTAMLQQPGVAELYRDDDLFETSEVAELVRWIVRAPAGLLHGANIVCGRSQPPMLVN